MAMAKITTRTWQPLLEGALAAGAWEAIEAVAGDLADPGRRFQQVAPVDVAAMRGSLASGDAGLALFFAYLHQACPGRGFDSLSLERLERARQYVAGGRTAPHLFSGFVGVAWTLDQLAGRVYGPDGEDANAEIDELLEGFVARTPWKREYDLTSGLVGHAVYALSRLPRASAGRALEQIVARLDELALARPEGLTWHTPVEHLPDGHERALYPQGSLNLGVAHGVPGVVAVLARIAAAGVACATARRLAAGALSWMLAQRFDDGESLFPRVAADAGERRFSRAAWCYGDPGIAATLLLAARALGCDEWEREARLIAERAAGRPEPTCGVRDASLCHGSAGLAHLFNRIYQASGDERLRRAALDWYERTLRRRTPGQGVGGYLGWQPVGERSTMAWTADASFLTGGAGIALALLGGVTPLEPAWDEVLLLSPIASAGPGAP